MPPGIATRQCEKLAACNTCHTFQNFKTGNQVIFFSYTYQVIMVSLYMCIQFCVFSFTVTFLLFTNKQTCSLPEKTTSSQLISVICQHLKTALPEIKSAPRQESDSFS